MYMTAQTNIILLDVIQPVDLPHEAMMVGALIALGCGLVSCFFGYRLLNLLLGLSGFTAGWLIGSAVGAALGESMLWAIVGGLACGVVGATLFVLLYLLGVFAMGGFLGWLLGGFIVSFLDRSLYPVLPAILATAGGVTAMVFRRFIIITATSFMGAWAVVGGGNYLLAEEGNIPFDVPAMRIEGGRMLMVMGIWIGLSIFGMAAQYMFTAPIEPSGRKGSAAT